MRHKRAGKKLGRDSSQRRALYSNLAGALIEHGRIKTTEAKAKAVKPEVEQLITLAKRGDLHARRQALSALELGRIVDHGVQIAPLHYAHLSQMFVTRCLPRARRRQFVPAGTVIGCTGHVSGTRGGAAAVAQIDRARGLLRYAGVGNIGATLVGPERRRGLPSHNGIVGSIVGRVRGFEYEWTQGDVLVMHSDGLQSRWTMDGVAGMVHRDPAVVAALLVAAGVLPTWALTRRGRTTAT